MANPATINNSAHSPGEEMRVPFALSAIFHLALLLLAIFGMHLLPTKKLDVPPPIAISLVNPSDMARTNHVDTPREEKEPPEPQISKAPELPKESSSSTTPPPPPEPPVEQKVETPPPPPPPPEKPPEKALPKLAPVPQAQTAFQQPAQLPPLHKPVKIVKPQPQQPPKPDQKTKQVDQDFDSLLKNLTPVEKADQISKDKPVKSHPKAGAQGALTDQLSADEKALIHERLKMCWIMPPGALDSGISVPIKAHYNEDKTLRLAEVGVTSEQYNGDPLVRAIADSAIRALQNPVCNPLPLPDGKYDVWKDIVMNFDPKND